LIEDGVPYLTVHNVTDSVERKNYEYVNYDTIFKEPVYSGRFKVKSSDLESRVFISDKEILSFNLENNTFEFAPSVVKRLETLKDSTSHGIQFAITVNEKPQLSGYFKHWSVWCNWYYMQFWKYKEGEGAGIKNRNSFELFNGYMRGKHEDLTPPYPEELIKALRSSGRLIE